MKKKSLYPYPGCRKIIHYLVMKTFFYFLVLLTLQANANVYSQQVKLNLEGENGSFKDIINEIGRQSGVQFRIQRLGFAPNRSERLELS